MPKSEAVAAIKHAQRRETCLHRNASSSECSGLIVRAHTVQESLLRQIAESGRIYGFPKDMGAIIRSNGVPTPQLIGVSQASTFTGFCAKHDDEFFAPIEKYALQPCAQHVFLLAYRAVCHELYDKRGVTSLEPHLRQIDRGFHQAAQRFFQSTLAPRLKGASAGLRDVERQKRRLDQVLATQEYGVMRYCWILLDGVPDLMCSSCFVPKWDFQARKIQDLANLDSDVGSVAVSLLSSENRGCAVLSWHTDHDSTCLPFVQSLLELPDEQLPHALVRLITGNMQNQFWAPKWWDTLAADVQGAILERFRATVSPSTPISPNHLIDDGIRAVSWKIISRISNVAGCK
jgi:hypothetical protein